MIKLNPRSQGISLGSFFIPTIAIAQHHLDSILIGQGVLPPFLTARLSKGYPGFSSWVGGIPPIAVFDH